MPLFEVETSAHIIITWADDEEVATAKARDAYPTEQITRITKRPRDTWVISKAVLVGEFYALFGFLFALFTKNHIVYAVPWPVTSRCSGTVFMVW